MKIVFAGILPLFILIATVHASQPTALIIRDSAGKEIIVDKDNEALATQSFQIKPIGIAEGFVFPTTPPRRKKYPSAETIFTGVYSERIKQRNGLVNEKDEKSFVESDEDIESDNKVNKPVIAWITKEGDFFHNPYLATCGSYTPTIWIRNIADLNGLEPCPNCFIQIDHAPDFIFKECGGLDLATAGALLDNSGFIAWVEQNLPVKKAVFLTSRKLLIYPKMEMTNEALRELAHETAMAYRRHTWKVIEVLAKKNETDLENISSF